MPQKKFIANLEYLYDMLGFIKDSADLWLIPSDILNQVILAAEEALVNIISYGYPNHKKGTIEILCEKTKEKEGIKIVIKDQGVPFNPVESMADDSFHPLTKKNEDEPSLGGYGIYILTGLMDRVEYQRIGDGNMLSLFKYLHL